MFGWVEDAWDAAKGVVSDVGDWVGGQADDYMNVGKNRYQGTPYEVGELNYGGQYGADNIAAAGFDQMNKAGQGGAWAQGQAQDPRGAQAYENQQLSDMEAQSRGWDQSGALQLAREGAMGMGPSAAGYQLQQGLDRSLAQQSAIAGGARGAAGIAMAGANANASSANLQNQAFSQAGQLRAQEMQQYQNMYGGLASQQRSQDQNRLQMGNQMSQFNAGLNDQYRLGMGQLANQSNQNQLGWYGAAQHSYDQQGQMDVAREQIAADSYNQNESRTAGVAQATADAKAKQTDRIYNTVLGTINNGAQMGIGGSKP